VHHIVFFNSSNFSDVTQSQIEYKFDEPEDDGATTSFPEDESISTVVSAPPKSQGNKVQTIKELDNAAQFDLPTTKVSSQLQVLYLNFM
jgi:hypothetical protein